MTISYQFRVANTSLFGFFKLLSMWRGSVYKLVFKETLIFSTLYAAISLIYRFALDSEQKDVFEKIAKYCNQHTSLIPVSFVLGFYVSMVVNRWWQQFLNVPWPDRTLYMTAQYLHGDDEKSRIMRRTIARYILFGLILILRSTSISVMKRFPTINHIVDAGFITHEEAVLLESVECKYHKFWVPMMWVNNLLTQARKEGRIDTDWGLRMIMEPLADFRDKLSICFQYDWITIPLVYTQVATLSVYIFFLACLVGRQYTKLGKGEPGYDYDLFVPVFTLLQFFFYMGWLKVAEQLINPFGEDDDDYDMNWLLDRHYAVAMCLVDQCHGKYPPLVRDAHFHEVVSDLPYTEASLSSKRPNFLGSTFNLAKLTDAEQRFVNPLDYNLENRRHSSFTGVQHEGGRSGSIWSLLSWRQHRQRSQMAASRESVHSSQPSRKLSCGYRLLQAAVKSNSDMSDEYSLEDINVADYSETASLSPDSVPLKQIKVLSDADDKIIQLKHMDKSRKSSFPNDLIRTQKQTDSEENTQVRDSVTSSSSHKQRFVVEPVHGDIDVDTTIHRRNAQLFDKQMTGKVVLRSPVLSAIEEVNTITSLKQILSSATCSVEDITAEQNVETIQEEPEK
ncbi:hypothetical protein CHS0354_004272 [Potamilus streckersoni]|uniref:Bestrophin homolog n=1 Tax=Potamilus streckersoni TaxID=2493646 RepID=A0AAE0S4T8_9BIVA|nr:hypothetical protein CHS0354_004272 [Potamilus streckersoni]